MQPRRHFVQGLKAGPDPRNYVLVLGILGDLVHGPLDQVSDVVEAAAAVFVRDIHDLAFGIGQDVFYAVCALDSARNDLLAGIDQVAQDRLLVDDSGIVFSVKRSRRRCQDF